MAETELIGPGALTEPGIAGVYTEPGIPGIVTAITEGAEIPVKTMVLRAIKAMVEEIVSIGSVIARPGKTIDWAVAKYPAVHLWDGPETIVHSNRVAKITMPLRVEVRLKDHEMTISEQADWIAALLYERFLQGSVDFKAWGLLILPGEGQNTGKFYSDEMTGGIVLHYNVQYTHEWGNPFVTGK